jgi:hypothetical protein
LFKFKGEGYEFSITAAKFNHLRINILMNRLLTTVLILCLGLIFLPSFTGHPPAAAAEINRIPNDYRNKEQFDSSLAASIRSVDELVKYIDDTYTGAKNTDAFLLHMSNIISLRFYHGYSYYSNDDNWIASISGHCIWNDLNAIVIPDDILKHPNAACSQQTIVLMECARRFGLPYRQVNFDHHFAAEIKIGKKWRYVDTNREVITINESLDDLIRNKQLYSLYQNKVDGKQPEEVLGHPRLGRINEFPAVKAMLFQETTGWISRNFFWIVLLLESVFFYLFNREKINSRL